MSLGLRIRWWLEEQKSKLPGWVLIGWAIYTGVPDLFDATHFWMETVKAMGGKVGLIATIIDSPWFSLILFILGMLYLRYVGEVQRPLRHPIWPILGWGVVGVVALSFWSVLVAGYVAVRIPHQMVGEAKTTIDNLTQTNQQLQQKVTVLEQRILPRVVTDTQRKKLSEALSKVPSGVTYELMLYVIPNCAECSSYREDLWDIFNQVSGWRGGRAIFPDLDVRVVGLVVVVDAEVCLPEELQLLTSALDAAGFKYKQSEVSGIELPGKPPESRAVSRCIMVIGSQPRN